MRHRGWAEDLGRMGLVAHTQDTFYGPATGRDSERTRMAVVAEANDDAGRFLRMVNPMVWEATRDLIAIED